jgi:hypothetical protein
MLREALDRSELTTPSQLLPQRRNTTAALRCLATTKKVHRAVTATPSQRFSPACFQPVSSTLAWVSVSTGARTAASGSLSAVFPS